MAAISFAGPVADGLGAAGTDLAAGRFGGPTTVAAVVVVVRVGDGRVPGRAGTGDGRRRRSERRWHRADAAAVTTAVGPVVTVE